MLSFAIGKLLPMLVLPPCGSILLIIAAAFWRRRAAVLITVAVLWVYLPSTPAVSNRLGESLESRFPPVAVSAVPTVDAIVLLGGSLHVPTPVRTAVEFNEHADRVWMAAKLYRAGKAPWVVVTGSNMPLFGEVGESEARAAYSLLRDWGVPAEAITLEERSYNTHENATYTKPILAVRGSKRILLVTSAWHMQRAAAVFRHEGIDAFPVGTDYLTGWGEPDLPFRWMPQARNLSTSILFMQEWIGLAVYRLRGWA